MGDVLTLIEKAEAEIDEEKARQMSQKLKKAQFDSLLPASLEHLHHLLHLCELLHHTVHFADVHTGSFRDPVLP